jgi:hypothetical protein
MMVTPLFKIAEPNFFIEHFLRRPIGQDFFFSRVAHGFDLALSLLFIYLPCDDSKQWCAKRISQMTLGPD